MQLELSLSSTMTFVFYAGECFIRMLGTEVDIRVEDRFSGLNCVQSRILLSHAPSPVFVCLCLAASQLEMDALAERFSELVLCLDRRHSQADFERIHRNCGVGPFGEIMSMQSDRMLNSA